MKQIEKDLLFLALLKMASVNVESLIEDYDQEKIVELAKTFEIFRDKNKLHLTIEELSNDVYKRIRKKFSKEKK